MGMIHVLPEIVANKIAAGEVIERPASIIKELVENSLDAGATSIEISISHGGKGLIRVSDNGAGMTAEDAEIAFMRHATSKIASAEDLERIMSFGFRGEALASVAAVSRVKMMTRLKGESAGTEVIIEGGKMLSVKPCSCREGTIIEVRDLFFNTPARRKFVKADSTEVGHALDVVSYLAFANPEVRFNLQSNDKPLLDLIPAMTLLERVRDVWKGEESGQLLGISDEGEGIRIRGVIGKPALNRANRSGQVYFVNRRWVKSPGMSFAVQDGYHGLIMQGQYPVVVIFIDVDPERVDVNVHPTKQEVRLSKEGEIKSLLRRAIAEALQKSGDLTTSLRIPESVSGGFRPAVPTGYFQFQTPAPQEVSALHVAEPGSLPAFSSEISFKEPVSFRDKLHVLKVLGQIHNTFIIAETTEGMIVIDQHAAHERVMFEALVREFESGNPQKQGLLMGGILELHPRQCELMTAALPLLSKMGYEIEAFGENAFVIRAYPAVLEKEDAVGCIQRFLEEKEEGNLKSNLENYKEELAALIACKKKSVKAHDAMPGRAMQILIEGLARCENPYHCPHGRPTFFKHTFSDLEQQFKRK